MTAPTNHWKLGAFVGGTVLLALAGAVVLAGQAMQVETVSYTSYFDEAVTGLEVGSPVTFRGVKIGSVSDIDVAQDRRHVEVTTSLSVEVLKRLGLASTRAGEVTRLAVPPGLRVQLASTGLTGIKYLQIDFFEVEGAPPEVLPFPVPANFLPATPSTLKNVEGSVVRALDQLPDLVQKLDGLATRSNALLDELAGRQLPAKAAATLDGTARLVGALQGKLDEIPAAALARQAGATLAALEASLARLDRTLERLDGEDGLLASALRTSDQLGEVAGPRLGADLAETGRDVREAAVAIRQLTEALQRDPDMLLKGKAEVRR